MCVGFCSAFVLECSFSSVSFKTTIMNSSDEDTVKLRRTKAMLQSSPTVRLQTFRPRESSSESSTESLHSKPKTTKPNTTNLKQIKTVLDSLSFGKNKTVDRSTKSTRTSEHSESSIKFEVDQTSNSDISLDINDTHDRKNDPLPSAQVVVPQRTSAISNGNKTSVAPVALTSTEEIAPVVNIPPSTQKDVTPSSANTAASQVNSQRNTIKKDVSRSITTSKKDRNISKTPVRTHIQRNDDHSSSPQIKSAVHEEVKPQNTVKEVEVGSDMRSDSEIDEILPRSSGISRSNTNKNNIIADTGHAESSTLASVEARTIPTPLHREAAQSDPVERMLLRARQRLQEQTAVEASAPKAFVRTPIDSPRSFSRFITPDRKGSYSEKPSTSHLALPNNISGLLDDKSRRLQQEVQRLQEEVLFLSKENQKLKSANRQQDAAQYTQLQMTVDVLRSQLHDEEMQKRAAEESALSVQAEMDRMLGEVNDQLQSYMSTASQYEKLYTEKMLEIEDLKTNSQVLRNRIKETEEKEKQQRLLFEQQRSHDLENMERIKALLEESKRQRSQLLELNEKIHKEKEAAIMDRRQMKDELHKCEEDLRRKEEKHIKECNTLEEDCNRLKISLAEKDRLLSAQLRSAQQANDMLQQRLTDVSEQMKEDAERQRRSYEISREEARQTIATEREKRLELEKQVKSLEDELRHAKRSVTERANHDLNELVVSLKNDLSRVCKERDDLHGQLRDAKDALKKLQETCNRYEVELDSLTEKRRVSEEFMHQIDTQRGKLAETLEHMLMQNDQLREENAVLRADVDDREAALRDAQLQMGSLVSLQDEVHCLTQENERLSEECDRLSGERAALIEENGKIAEEVLKWRNELRRQITLPRVYTPQRAGTQLSSPRV
ncbi:BRCT domain-containing protein [Trypanosoma theileri]|uniref:BRCT domain-containing protein n=1 Tax=Trypanosoma theileri TaxID=67003 RepID=A0A1X0NJ20_9TRYP|nr:BRCT domain-containing protein [Trypanosoma theileri]ORC84735.1 BRCT domain-containing protein [Trypanosoma theileri]